MDGGRALLLVDIGNTSIHWAVHDGAWGADRRLPTCAAEAFDAGPTAPAVAVICPGVPDAAERIAAELRRRGAEVRVLGEDLRAAMPTRYVNPAQLGPDRLANAVAAYARVGAAVIVVDVGTALTVDVVSDGGEFLGGAIAPGPHRAWEGLVSGLVGPGFTSVETDWLDGPPGPASPVGRSTRECLDAGFRLGFAGLVDRLIREQRQTLGLEAPVLWTGGAADLIRPHSDHPGELDGLLTLRGLALIHEQAASLP